MPEPTLRADLVLAPWALSMSGAMAEKLGFEADAVGQPAAGWTCGATERGSPRWPVEADATASGESKVGSITEITVLDPYFFHRPSGPGRPRGARPRPTRRHREHGHAPCQRERPAL